MRLNNRADHQLRPIQITRHYTKHAEGAVLIECGDTKVLCTASVSAEVPPFLKNTGKGWVTAEYGMLPRSTQVRMLREAAKGKQTGRTQEIQRLIGRSLRAAVNLELLEGYTIVVDCDVIQADGGTRTAAITGGCVALHDAIEQLRREQEISAQPFVQYVAAVSVGMVAGVPILDLDYTEDSSAEADINVVMTEHGSYIEVQGTAEKGVFSQSELDTMLTLAKEGAQQLVELQKSA